MASNAAVTHKQRAVRAYIMMENLGIPKHVVTPILRTLLKAYDNQWDFIEAENYRALIDFYFDQQAEGPKNASSSGGDDDSLSLQGADDGGGGDREGELHHSPPPSPSLVTRAAYGTRSRSAQSGCGSGSWAVAHPGANSSPSPPPPPRGSHPHAIVKVESSNFADAVAYHSGENARLRAIGGGVRGFQDDPDPAALAAATAIAASLAASVAAATAAQEKAKGKLPLCVASSSRRNSEEVPGIRLQEQRQQQKQYQWSPSPASPLPSSPLPSSNRRTGPAPALVKVKFEIGSEPETARELEYVNVAGCEAGTIRETAQATELAPSLSVAAFGSESFEIVEPAGIGGRQVLTPAPLQAFDPVKGDLIRVEAEPVDEFFKANQSQAARPGEGIPAAAPGADPGERLQVISYEGRRRPLPFGGIPRESPLAVERGTSGVAQVIKREANECENDYERRIVYQPPVISQGADEGGARDDGGYVMPNSLIRLGPSGNAGPMPKEAPIETSADLPRELNDEESRPNFILVRSKEAEKDRSRAVLKDRRGAVAEIDRRGAQAEIDDVSIGSRVRERQQGRNSNRSNDDGCLVNSGDEKGAGVKRKLVHPAACTRSSAEGNGGTSGGGGSGSAVTSRGNGAATGGGRSIRSNSSSSSTALELVAAAEPRGQQQQQEQQQQGRQNGLKRPKREEVDVVVLGDEGKPHHHYRKHPKHNSADISRGTERMAIPVVNEYTSESIPENFNYIPSNVVYQMAHINNSLARIGDEDCCMSCTGDCLQAPHSCPCSRDTGGVYAYTPDGLLKHEVINYELDSRQDPDMTPKIFCGPDNCPIERAKNDVLPDKCKGHDARRFIKECWHKCGCSTQCGNRVVQRGISRRLQVFFTSSGKGWGIRTLEDLPAGAFVCEYVGEIVTNVELDQRNQEMMSANKSADHKHTFPVLLDGDWCSERGLKDEEALCLDATKYGNVARFINHRCSDANLIDIPVSIECLDRHYYHIAFFANRFVRAGEELTWDYRIDFDDKDHPIEAFRCLCDSELCRGSKIGKKKQKR